MRKPLTTFATSLLVLFLGSIHVYADSMPWGYSASTTTISSGSSSIEFKGVSGVASGDSAIIPFTLATFSTATPDAPDSFSMVPFNLVISLTDIQATGSLLPSSIPTGTVQFSGLFNATKVSSKSLLPGATTWTPVPGNVSPTQAIVVLGSPDTGWREYHVELSSFTAPGQPGGAPGSIQAIVTLHSEGPSGGDPGPSPTPEPATIVLGALGLPLFLLRRRLRLA